MNARDNTIALTQQTPERHQPRLYHDLLTPAETLAIREEVRRFADEHVALTSTVRRIIDADGADTHVSKTKKFRVG